MPTAESWYKAHGIEKGGEADGQAGQDWQEEGHGQSDESDAAPAEARSRASPDASTGSRSGGRSSGFVQTLGGVPALLLVTGAGLLLLVALFMVLGIRAGWIR
jgi:hypothetical protein